MEQEGRQAKKTTKIHILVKRNLSYNEKTLPKSQYAVIKTTWYDANKGEKHSSY